MGTGGRGLQHHVSFPLVATLTPPLCKELGRVQRKRRARRTVGGGHPQSHHQQATYPLPFFTTIESGGAWHLGRKPLEAENKTIVSHLGCLRRRTHSRVFRVIKTHWIIAFLDGTLCEEMPRKREEPRIWSLFSGMRNYEMPHQQQQIDMHDGYPLGRTGPSSCQRTRRSWRDTTTPFYTFLKYRLNCININIREPVWR